MKKRKNGYVKISRNLFDTKELYELKKEEKSQGIGVFMIIVMHLAKYENAVGNDETLKILSVLTGKKKWYVWHIITDFGLFNVKGDEFQCRLLQKSFNVETFLGPEVCTDDIRRDEDDDENGSSSSNLSSEISSNLSSDSFSGLHNKEQAQARRSPIQNTNIQNTKNIGTGVPIKDTTTIMDFENVVNKIFNSPNWLRMVEQNMRLNVHSDETVRQFVRQRFIEEITLNGSHDDGEPFTEARAKRYFVNWIRPGKMPRTELNRKINDMLAWTEKERQKKADKPFYGFGTIDRDGHRRGPHGELVPMDAPPCVDDMTVWCNETQSWE